MKSKSKKRQNLASCLGNDSDYQTDFCKCSTSELILNFSLVFFQEVYLMKDVVVLKIVFQDNAHTDHIFLKFDLQWERFSDKWSY